MNIYGLSNIFFYNHLNKKGIKKILSNSDLYLCLSKYESSPMSVWEAMSYSLPILSTNVGDLEYFNKRFKFGFVVKENRIKTLEKQILKIYYNKKLRNKFGQNSKKFVLEKIDLKKTMGNLQKNIFIYA
jgi:glycosyltransferase involved in cell wall biosynthesis